MPAPPNDPPRRGAPPELLAEQRRRWQAGAGEPAEAVLRRHPRLSRSARLDLIVQEYLLRRQFGPPAMAEEFVRRFPQLREELKAQLSGVEALLEAPAVPSIPGYEILEVLGEGGMGVVYKARQVRLDRVVALKRIRAGVGASPQEVAYFIKEGKAAAKLHHPGIAAVYDAGVHEGQPYLVMQFVKGAGLDELLERTGPLGPDRAARILRDVAVAIGHAHENGVLHRDLKPSNILIQDNGAAVVLDFGCARRLMAHPGAARGGRRSLVVGTPGYMAPEQAEGNSRLNPAADVYALGVVLFEMLTGKLPAESGAVASSLERARDKVTRPLSQRQAALHRRLEAVCTRCLEWDPARRYASGNELAAALVRCAETPTGSPKVDESVGTRLASFPTLIAGLTLALGIGGVTYWTLQLGKVDRGKSPPGQGGNAPFIDRAADLGAFHTVGGYRWVEDPHTGQGHWERAPQVPERPTIFVRDHR